MSNAKMAWGDTLAIYVGSPVHSPVTPSCYIVDFKQWSMFLKGNFPSGPAFYPYSFVLALSKGSERIEHMTPAHAEAIA